MMKKATAFILSLIILSLGGGSFAKADTLTVPRFLPQSTYLSPVKQSPIKFTGLGIDWHQLTPVGTNAELAVRFKTEAGWSDWNKLAGDIDGPVDSAPEYPSAFLPTNESDTLQYRVYLQTVDITKTPVIENIRFTYINSKETVAALSEKLVASIGPVTADPATLEKIARIKTPTSGQVKIISRSEWGADESLRVYSADRPAPQLVKVDDDFYKTYASEMKIVKKVTKNSDGKDLTWPLEYPEKISKIIIHHTATTKNLDDPEKAIRDIYYWHAITKGWGDIGYNYIIDQQGNIYEGRYGGDGVVGAHAGKANVGSIGIAILGNYQDNQVPDAVLNSLVALIKVKAKKYNIDPTGSSSFRGEVLPNIIGHRDVMSTTCPGDNLYALLPAIRLAAKGDYKPQLIDRRRPPGNTQGYDYVLQKNPDIISLKPGETQTLKISLKNTGTIAWGSDTYLLVSDDQNAQTFLAQSSMVRSDSAGKNVPPGSSVTFNLNLQGSYNGGIATLEIFPFIDGKTRIEKYISLPLQVESPNYDYEFVSLTLDKSSLKKGEVSQARLILKNTGNTTWKRDGKNKIMIGTEKPRDHKSLITIRPDARLASLQEREVAPGHTGQFVIKIKAPANEGMVREYFAPVIEGITWLPFKNNYLEFFVYNSQFLARLSNVGGDKILLPGQSGQLELEYQNQGGSIWKTEDDKGFHLQISDQNNLKIGQTGLDRSDILPGQKASVTLGLTAPATEGIYKLEIMPKVGSRNLAAKPDTVTVTVSKQRSSEQNLNKQEATSDIRVDLSFHDNPIISADGKFKLFDGEEETATFNKNEKVSVTYDQGKYLIKGDKQAFAFDMPPRFEPDGTAVLRIDNYDHRPDWNKTYNDNEYLGALEVHWYDSEMHVVNELPVEDYLKGLAEISATDPYEKIKAVIVLARTYAFYYTTVGEKFPGAPFNLTDDPERSQKYLGYGFEKRNPTGIKAVNDTAGLVVTWNGKIVKTPYFSSDDGRTRSAEEVWGWKDTPWLISVKDPGCEGLTMNGHGVGLSGCGSLYFANQGKTYEEIIKYYFQGVKIEKQK